jgi:hypothetical protein
MAAGRHRDLKAGQGDGGQLVADRLRGLVQQVGLRKHLVNVKVRRLRLEQQLLRQLK